MVVWSIPVSGQCHYQVCKSSDSSGLPRRCIGTLHVPDVPKALIALQVSMPFTLNKVAIQQ